VLLLLLLLLLKERIGSNCCFTIISEIIFKLGASHSTEGKSPGYESCCCCCCIACSIMSYIPIREFYNFPEFTEVCEHLIDEGGRKLLLEVSVDQMVSVLKERLATMISFCQRICKIGACHRMKFRYRKIIQYLESPIFCDGRGRFLACKCLKAILDSAAQYEISEKEMCLHCKAIRRIESFKEFSDSSFRVLKSNVTKPADCRCIVCMIHTGEFYKGDPWIACSRDNFSKPMDQKNPLQSMCNSCLTSFAINRHVKEHAHAHKHGSNLAIKQITHNFDQLYYS
jgi:hypothetical protein